jgi:nondiscriminating glutamyl-tRNA synthetase
MQPQVMNIRTRFAPSPTGWLHLGNVRTALFNALWAYQQKGEFLLRLEDTDTARSSIEFAEAIKKDLLWLGLNWKFEGGDGVVRQSQRQVIYTDFYQKLQAIGAAYPCFCTTERLMRLREAQRLAYKSPGYDGYCRTLSPQEVKDRCSQDESYVLRFRVPDEQTVRFNDLIKGAQCFESDHFYDFVIKRSDGSPAFLYCNALDDALMNITHVLRGEDHLTNTAKQLLLLQAMHLQPPVYGHMPLISQQGASSPLSKRENSFSLQMLRQRGYLPHAIINYLGRLGHTISVMDFMDLNQLSAAFSVKHIHAGYAQFDESQLNFWQKQAMRHQTAETLWEQLDSTCRQQVPEATKAHFMEVIQPMALFPSEIETWSTILFLDPLEYSFEAKSLIQKVAATFWAQLLKICNKATDRDQNQELVSQLKLMLNSISDKVQRKLHWKALRIALTGRETGPDLSSLVQLLGISRVCRRLEQVATLVNER